MTILYCVEFTFEFIARLLPWSITITRFITHSYNHSIAVTSDSGSRRQKPRTAVKKQQRLHEEETTIEVTKDEDTNENEIPNEVNQEDVLLLRFRPGFRQRPEHPPSFPAMATVSFKYWDDCVDPDDLEAMWMEPDVRAEWINVGETKGSKVHLSRDPDGQPYLTQTEMRDMLCAIAELESDRQPLATSYNKKPDEVKMGIMQITPKIAEWLTRERSEEFMVRAYKGGTKKATHKSTLPYWKKYLAVKESLPSRSYPYNLGLKDFPEDMEEMWNNPEVNKEWTKSGEKKGKVRFSHDVEKHPYLSRVELKAVAEIILAKHFSVKRVKPSVLCALSEMVSMRFVNGVGQRTGLMGIDYPTARWLYKHGGYKAYMVESVEDLTKPFVSMYFGAAYMNWLSEYEGRERDLQFVVQAYLSGPQNVNLQETGPLWVKFEEALNRYEGTKR
ncbi:hypothetical protein DH2020_042379 [Rehmannia glutinosa]|uniref:Transglycosylase SLT domain-containing protein n=2 Tax=Rehmannia glutinosa TaxID=99300 RepID=A0ABR0UNP0_REHGL